MPRATATKTTATKTAAKKTAASVAKTEDGHMIYDPPAPRYAYKKGDVLHFDKVRNWLDRGQIISAFDEMTKQLSPWDAPSKTDAIYRETKQRTLQNVIHHMVEIRYPETQSL